MHMHQNETIFPEAYKFKPERWLEKRAEGKPPLDRYLVSFSKGSRQCVGMQYVIRSGSDFRISLTASSVAKMELLLTIATGFRRFDKQELFETTRTDVDIQYDIFLPQAALDLKVSVSCSNDQFDNTRMNFLGSSDG